MCVCVCMCVGDSFLREALFERHGSFFCWPAAAAGSGDDGIRGSVCERMEVGGLE